MPQAINQLPETTNQNKAFDTALNIFKETGIFELNNASLHLGQLSTLETYIDRRYDQYRQHNLAIPYCQFHLNNVYIIPRYSFEEILIDPTNEHKQVVEENNHEGHVDTHRVRVGAPADKMHFQLETSTQASDFNSQKLVFEKALFYLLTRFSTWDDIQLNDAYFSNNNTTYPLSLKFANNLLKKLDKNEVILKKLSLTGIDLEQTILVETLARASTLEFLGLKINWSQDYDFHWLIPALAKHPSLVALDLGDIPLRRTSYNELASLLFRNYRINKLKFKEPEKFFGLEEVHERINRRLAGDRKEQFKSEQLNENKLVSLAEEAIQFNHLEYLQVVLSYQLDLGTITAEDKEKNKEIWVQRACRILPEVYKNHSEYLQEASSLVALHLNQTYKNTNKTIGYYLLEKAFQIKSERSIKLLLQAGANIFEAPTGQKIFLLKQLFDGNECPPWKEAVIEHIEQNLSTLAPQISKLNHFFGLYPTFNTIKKHLDNYLDKLKNRMNHPIYTRVIIGVYAFLGEKYQQYIQNLHHLVDSIAAVTTVGLNKEGNIAYVSMMELIKYSKEMIEDTKKADRGFLHRAELNDGLIRLGEELNDKINRCKDILHHRELNRAKAINVSHTLEKSILAERKVKEKKQAQRGQFDAKLAENYLLKEQLNDRDVMLLAKEEKLKKIKAENTSLHQQVNAQGIEIKELREWMLQFLSEQAAKQSVENPTQKETTRAGPSLFKR